MKNVQIEPLGEAAFILRHLEDVPAWAVAQALARDPRIEEAAPAYDTVGVYVRPGLKAATLKEILESLEIADVSEPKTHIVPVCYELGLDFAEVQSRLSLRPSEVIRHHLAPIYTCFAVGFAPGFPFLGYLDDALAGLPRRSSPRPHVPPGSVGITGRQTGIYPSSTPGGWNLIGRTPLILADLEDAYFPIAAGDQIQFESISASEFEALEGKRL